MLLVFYEGLDGRFRFEECSSCCFGYSLGFVGESE